jgi:hypothetical protein
MPDGPRSWIRFGVLCGAIGLGTWLRLRGLSELPLHGDEYHTLLAADGSYGSILTTFDAVGSHVALPLLQKLSLDVCGAGIVPFRLVAIVPGLLVLFLAYPLLRAFVSADAAALAGAALALDPLVVYYARFARGYSLALLLALVLGWAVRRVLEPTGRGRRTWCALVAAGALLPWVHLSTLGFVLAVALAALALALRESRALAGQVLAAFAAAGGLALLLFLPVFDQVVRYFQEMKSEPPPLDWFGVPTLLAGGRAAAWIWLVLLPVGCGLCWRERRASVVLAGAGLCGPLALLLFTNPRGMDYAWARYLLSALPFLAALVASALTSLAGLVARSGESVALAVMRSGESVALAVMRSGESVALAVMRSGESVALVLGAGLLLFQHWAGPLGPSVPQASGYSNTYLAMHELPAFDEPYPAMPEFYRTLGEDPSARCIVELPPLFTRAVLLYRNYALLHGQDVLVGWTSELPRGIQRGPYVRPLELEPGQADYVVLHRDQVTEVPAYFRFVFEDAWPRQNEPADETFMLRQETIYPQNLVGTDVTDGIAGQLRAKYGAAFYKDEYILVWKLGR